MANIFDMADTWNAGGTTFTAIKMNVTDTASAAASLLMDLQVGGSSKFKVDKAGAALIGDGAAASPSLSFINASGAGLFKVGASSFGMSASGASIALLFSSGLDLGSGKGLFWDSAAAPGGTPDLALYRDAANTLAQRSGINAQAFNIYNTYTDASNYERGVFKWSSNNLFIGTDHAGTGVARTMNFQTGGTARWQITSSGHFQANTDNAYDIGASGANRPRNIIAAGVIRGNTMQIFDGITAPAATAGLAIIYVDSADGDLKVVFGDGTVKTIVTDT